MVLILCTEVFERFLQALLQVVGNDMNHELFFLVVFEQGHEGHGAVPHVVAVDVAGDMYHVALFLSGELEIFVHHEQ